MGIWTQSDIDTLKAAISSGVLTVRFEGPPMRLITYQDLKEMRDLLASMINDVAGSSGGATATGATSFRLAASRKGV